MAIAMTAALAPSTAYVHRVQTALTAALGLPRRRHLRVAAAAQTRATTQVMAIATTAGLELSTLLVQRVRTVQIARQVAPQAPLRRLCLPVAAAARILATTQATATAMTEALGLSTQRAPSVRIALIVGHEVAAPPARRRRQEAAAPALRLA